MLMLGLAVGVLLALLGAVCIFAVQMHFEARDREQLHQHLERAKQLLAAVDNTAALAELPAQMSRVFHADPDLAVRVQGALDQPLYEQTPQSAMPTALLAHPALAAPAPLVTWNAGGGALARQRTRHAHAAGRCGAAHRCRSDEHGA